MSCVVLLDILFVDLEGDLKVMRVPDLRDIYETSHCEESVLALGQGPRCSILLGRCLKVPVSEVDPYEVALNVLMPVFSIDLMSLFPYHKAQLHLVMNFMIVPQVKDFSRLSDSA